MDDLTNQAGLPGDTTAELRLRTRQGIGGYRPPLVFDEEAIAAEDERRRSTRN